MSASDLCVTAVPLSEGPFGDLVLPPSLQPKYFGGQERPTHDDAAAAVKSLAIHVGNRPVARRLRELYAQGHPDLPAGLELYDRYDVWIITHVVGAVRTGGSEYIQMLGYRADFDDEEVYTIDLAPHPKFNTLIGTTLHSVADLSIEGRAQLKDIARKFLPHSESLGGDAQLTVSAEANLVGRLSFSVITPTIQATGYGHSRCEWVLERDQLPLLNDQILLQTVLVPKGTDSLSMEAQGYALVKAPLLSRAFWTDVPALLHTKRLQLEVKLL